MVPILALIPLLVALAHAATTADSGAARSKPRSAAAVIAAVVLAGRYLLNPLFQLLAQANTREVMTAAALLVVIGTGLVMQYAGMSMALGAFLAGVLLAESNYRHELEADIEPFRGLLLALFFMGVGMSIDLSVVRDNLWLLIGGAIVVTIAQGRDRLGALPVRAGSRPRRLAGGRRAHRRGRVRLRAPAARAFARHRHRQAIEPRRGACRDHHADRPVLRHRSPTSGLRAATSRSPNTSSTASSRRTARC